MISAQVDQVIQEHLIEKYMMLPNQVWDDVISQASKVSYTNVKFIIKIKTYGYHRNRNKMRG